MLRERLLEASWGPPGGLLGASWEPLGVPLGGIWGLKMSIITQVSQTFSLLDAFGDAKLQALAIHAS